MDDYESLLDVLGLTKAQRAASDIRQFGDRYFPEKIAEAVAEGHCIDFRERIGGRVMLASRATGRGIDFAPWTWAHLRCARYRPQGQASDFYGGAPDWLTAWAYARRHMRNFHGVELGEAGWRVG